MLGEIPAVDKKKHENYCAGAGPSLDKGTTKVKKSLRHKLKRMFDINQKNGFLEIFCLKACKFRKD